MHKEKMRIRAGFEEDEEGEVAVVQRSLRDILACSEDVERERGRRTLNGRYKKRNGRSSGGEQTANL